MSQVIIKGRVSDLGLKASTSRKEGIDPNLSLKGLRYVGMRHDAGSGDHFLSFRKTDGSIVEHPHPVSKIGNYLGDDKGYRIHFADGHHVVAQVPSDVAMKVHERLSGLSKAHGAIFARMDRPSSSVESQTVRGARIKGPVKLHMDRSDRPGESGSSVSRSMVFPSHADAHKYIEGHLKEEGHDGVDYSRFHRTGRLSVGPMTFRTEAHREGVSKSMSTRETRAAGRADRTAGIPTVGGAIEKAVPDRAKDGEFRHYYGHRQYGSSSLLSVEHSPANASISTTEHSPGVVGIEKHPGIPGVADTHTFATVHFADGKHIHTIMPHGSAHEIEAHLRKFPELAGAQNKVSKSIGGAIEKALESGGHGLREVGGHYHDKSNGVPLTIYHRPVGKETSDIDGGWPDSETGQSKFQGRQPGDVHSRVTGHPEEIYNGPGIAGGHRLYKIPTEHGDVHAIIGSNLAAEISRVHGKEADYARDAGAVRDAIARANAKHAFSGAVPEPARTALESHGKSTREDRSARREASRG